MTKSVLVIGGTRFFGRILVDRLVTEGHQVTIATRGRASDTFGATVERIGVDRRDGGAMAAAFEDRKFDLVFDQMCYSPRDAEISTRVFSGRVGRYVMTSTIEVYDQVHGEIDRPLAEDDLVLDDEPVDPGFAWDDPLVADAHYGSGKRQAEAALLRHAVLPVVTVRVGHVLAGPEDFTGRLAHYVDRAVEGRTLRHAAGSGKSAFIDGPGIANFLAWVGGETFRGPVNAAAEGALSAAGIFEQVGVMAGVPLALQPVENSTASNTLSPFDYERDFTMDTRRAAALGHRFGHSHDWLDGLIAAHLADRATK
ncbi:MAG: NAD-dependent epimerase/dehydratase family protein [Hyphomicrobiales bacterium]|nr:NAD-dependent epimerase/dehydratase family protein [Hyphomicrobiales bacterium]